MKSFEKHRAVICKVRFTQNNNRAVKPSLFVDASSLQAVKPTLLRVKLGYEAEKMEKKSRVLNGSVWSKKVSTSKKSKSIP